MDEIRLAARRLTKRPVPALAAVLTLALAIGAASATWSALVTLLLRPIPVAEPERLAVVGVMETAGRAAGTVRTGLVYPYYDHLRASGLFERITATWSSPFRLLVDAGKIRMQALVGFAAHDAFDVLGVAMQQGRGFDRSDDRRGAPPTAVLTDDFWRRHLGADPAVVGRTITINRQEVSIVGVAAPGFRGLNLAQPVDLYVAFHAIAQVGPSNWNYFAEPNHPTSPSSGVLIIGRMARSAGVQQTSAQLTALAKPASERGTASLALVPLNTAAIPAAARAGMRRFGRLLAATVTLLLLVGCLAAGMLLLVRTEARREELGLCVALGASRCRLAGGIIAEGSLLALAGALLGIPVTAGFFRTLGTFELPGGVALERLNLTVDIRSLSLALIGAAAATILIAAVAGGFSLRGDAAESLRTRGGATPRIARRRTRALLVIVQVAVALVLVTGAGLFARSLRAAFSLNAGIEPSRVTTFGLYLTPYDYDLARANAFFDEFSGRLRQNPASVSVAASLAMGAMGGRMPVDGVPRQFPSQVGFTAIDSQYFRAMGLQVIEGRAFLETDTAHTAPVAIVSESFARLLGRDGTALGRRITMPYSRPPAPAPQVEVVGVVPDVITSVTDLQPLMIYMPLAQQAPSPTRDFTVRAGASLDAARREIQATLRRLDPAITPPPLYTLHEQLARQMNAQRFAATLLGCLGVLALLLTAVAIWVMSESAAMMRLREMGIRAALGATRPQLGRLVLAETARVVGAGLAVGLLLAWVGAGTVRALLFQVQPLDATTLGAVAAAILALSIAVTLRGALRAASVDVARALRSE